MKKNKKALIAYAAGIIDGEGSIDLHHYRIRERMKTENWSVRLQVKMNSGKALDLLWGLFGGRINLCQDRRKEFFPGFVWYLSTNKAVSALKAMIPFLRVKKSQAELAIQYQALISRTRADRNNSLSVYEQAERKKLVDKMHELNSQSVSIPDCHIRAGLETEQVEKARAFMRQSNLIENQQ